MFSCSQFREWFKRWVDYYFCFCWAAAFLSGLVFSYNLVDLAVVGVFITYFSENSRVYTLQKAAIFASIQDGISATLAFVVAICSSYFAIRPFRIIIFSTVSYTLALGILCYTASRKFSDPKSDLLNIIGMILLAVGEVGVNPLLGTFLADQLREHGGDGGLGRPVNQDHENKVMARTRVWWRQVYCCSVAVAFFTNSLSWIGTFMFTGLAMGISLILLLLGMRSYHTRESPSLAPPFPVFRVVKAALKKRHLNYPSSADQFFKNDDRNELHLSPRILRCLDKAAIIELDQEEENKVCTVAQVRESKLIFKILSMWFSFLVFGLVLSAGNTFFPEQGANMPSQRFLIFLLTFKPIFCATINYLSTKLISNCVPETKQRQAQMVRIVIGMVMSTICCGVAWQVEVHRIAKVQKDENMNMFWLVPQFCLLGLMEGLARYGMDEYLISYFPEQKDQVSAITCLFIGFGSLLNIFLILAYKSEFGDTPRAMRLNKYYLRLTVVSAVNTCCNLVLSILYFRNG